MELEKTPPLEPPRPAEIAEGDILLGLGCCGVFSDLPLRDPSSLQVDKSMLDTRIPELGCTVGEELQKPPRNYDGVLDKLLRRGLYPKAAIPITGSLCRIIGRAMPAGLAARIDTASFPLPPLFELIARHCKLSQQEMFHYFNMGIGLVIFISRQDVGQVKNALCCWGERTYVIGFVRKGRAGAELK